MNKSLFHSASIQRYRLDRVRTQLAQHDVAALLLFDPINIRYATGSRNMQVWTMHNVCRYALILNGGPLVLFDLPSASHVNEGNEFIDAIRPSITSDYMMVATRAEEMAERWARDITEWIHDHGGGNRRIAVDRGDLLVLAAAAQQGLSTCDGKGIMQHARAIKSDEEVTAFVTSLRTTEAAVTQMRASIEPGMRESDALSILAKECIARGGEYPETRLLSSGPRTNPWFQETSDRRMVRGDLLAFDTDFIGPGGFYNDISRSWTVGETTPTDEQRTLYSLAHEQLMHNTALIKPGAGFLDVSDAAYPLPEAYLENRYADVAHGCGMDVEYPLIWYREDEKWGAYDGRFEQNMIVCLECYVGRSGGHEGVKLEEPVLVTADGAKPLSSFPYETDWL